jgi:hypothetical protein
MEMTERRFVMPFLPDDVARCRGVGSDEEGWREGCDVCLRRLAPGNGEHVANMEPPLIVAFWCEFLREA